MDEKVDLFNEVGSAVKSNFLEPYIKGSRTLRRWRVTASGSYLFTESAKQESEKQLTFEAQHAIGTPISSPGSGP
jgi:hypothetical protein